MGLLAEGYRRDPEPCAGERITENDHALGTIAGSVGSVGRRKIEKGAQSQH
jgi:hypothetical protein